MTISDDSEDLARFGYRQELTRTLGSFSSFAAGFSYLSILTGLFQMFYLGFGAGGPAFIALSRGSLADPITWNTGEICGSRA